MLQNKQENYISFKKTCSIWEVQQCRNLNDKYRPINIKLILNASGQLKIQLPSVRKMAGVAITNRYIKGLLILDEVKFKDIHWSIGR